jgi:hypothetical protein
MNGMARVQGDVANEAEAAGNKSQDKQDGRRGDAGPSGLFVRFEFHSRV